MPNHEPANGPPRQSETPARPEQATSEAPAQPAPAQPAADPAPPAQAPAPRDLAQRVWGSWPSLPAGTAAPAAPAPGPPQVASAPDADVDFEVDDETFDADLVGLEERLRDTEDRLASLAASTEQSLRALGDTIRTSTAELPGVIERVVEQRLNAVGDALLKLADLRAKLQEETGEAVQSLRASFQTLEERLAETTQQQVQASIEQLVGEVRQARDEIARTTTAASGNGQALEAAEQRIRERVAELPTRGDFASIRGAIGTVATSLREELSAAVERIGNIEAAIASMNERREEPAAQEPPPAEQEVHDPFDGPLLDFPDR